MDWLGFWRWSLEDGLRNHFEARDSLGYTSLLAGDLWIRGFDCCWMRRNCALLMFVVCCRRAFFLLLKGPRVLIMLDVWTRFYKGWVTYRWFNESFAFFKEIFIPALIVYFSFFCFVWMWFCYEVMAEGSTGEVWWRFNGCHLRGSGKTLYHSWCKL